MNDLQLERSLRSVGKRCFVKYLNVLLNKNVKAEDLVEMFMKCEGYTEAASRTRVSNSRRIIAAGRTESALKIIAKSTKIDVDIRDQAALLLKSI